MNDSGKLPFTIGLTGGIGSGKSLVSQLFTELGVPVIDTDHISRDLVTANSENLKKIADEFGPDILLASGELDRGRLRQIIFSTASKKQWLEDLLHPQIRAVALDQLAACGSGYAILVVPLLLESGHFGFVDRIVVVDCPEEVQIERVMARDHCSHETARKIIDSQMPRRQRLARADDIIDNSGSPAELKKNVIQLHEKYQELSRHRDH